VARGANNLLIRRDCNEAAQPLAGAGHRRERLRGWRAVMAAVMASTWRAVIFRHVQDKSQHASVPDNSAASTAAVSACRLVRAPLGEHLD
jgi:hypothetical protein